MGKWTAKYSFPIPVDSVILSCESHWLWKRRKKKRCEMPSCVGISFWVEFNDFSWLCLRISWRFLLVVAIYHKKKGKNELWLKFPLQRHSWKSVPENFHYRPSCEYKELFTNYFCSRCWVEHRLLFAAIFWVPECSVVFAVAGELIHYPLHSLLIEACKKCRLKFSAWILDAVSLIFLGFIVN